MTNEQYLRTSSAAVTKKCQTCEYFHISSSLPPCSQCTNHSLWEPGWRRPTADVPKGKLIIREDSPTFPRIKKVIFNDPATIVLWDDNTKTVVKCRENDDFDWEKGLAMAISKKFFGNQGNYYNNFKKWEPEEVSDSIHIDMKSLVYDSWINALKKFQESFLPKGEE